MTPRRRIALTIAAFATLIAIASRTPAASTALTASSSAVSGAAAQRAKVAAPIANQNRAVLPALYATGGVPSADGKFVRTADGSEVSVAPASFADCPSGWVCLWSDASFTGRLLRWSNPGTRVNLSDIGLNDQMTSWANRGPYDARWFYNPNSSGTTRCMNPGTSNANVGTTDNDKASSLAVYTDSVACS